MSRPVRPVPVLHRRLLGLYALTLMERGGPLHGYGLSERIRERTAGAWRPGPGSVYPSLKRLVENGLARRRAAGRRQVYVITPTGRRFLAGLRQRGGTHSARIADESPLWAEVMGATDTATFLLERLQRGLAALEAEARRPTRSPADASRLAREVRRVVEARLRTWPRGAAGAATGTR